jgi:8-oxo-dGTP pyrophosphatase MutT (NUDIX family)
MSTTVKSNLENYARWMLNHEKAPDSPRSTVQQWGDAEMKHTHSWVMVINRGCGGNPQIALVQEKDGAWGLPGGRRNGDETPFETARRELREETGIYIPRESSMRHVGMFTWKKPRTKKGGKLTTYKRSAGPLFSIRNRLDWGGHAKEGERRATRLP